MMTLTSCHDKLNQWLLDNDSVELTDEFQLVNNFTVHETSSQLSIRSLIPKHFCHILHSSSRRTLKFIFNQTLISRDFSTLFRLPKLSIPQTENSLSTKACEAGAANRSTAETESWLYAFGQLLNQNSRGFCRPWHWFEYQQCICWLSVSLWLTWMHLLAGCQCL